MKKIILTGGGTAGHVTPNLALVPLLRENDFAVEYIGGVSGIEKTLAKECGLPYFSVSSGKLRRYLSIKNITDCFRVVKGFSDAYRILGKRRPNIVFSKGGFVSVPVALAARFRGIPLIIHESDMTPGLANKISMPFADYVCATFPETMRHLPERKARLTGSPIRAELLAGDRERGLRICGFSGARPVLLIMGGSQGSALINSCVRESLDILTKTFDIAHICGKGKTDGDVQNAAYRQFEYLSEELPHVLAACEAVVSRAGANSINEFLALKKPNLLIPLSKKASRGDQLLNAESFEKQGFSKVIPEEELETATFVAKIFEVYHERGKYAANMAENGLNNAAAEIIGLILKIVSQDGTMKR